MMTRLFLLLSLPALCSCARLDPPVPEESDPQGPDTLRVLAIGNSFSSDAVEQNLWELLDAAGIPAIIGNVSAPGSYLSHHWNRAVGNKAEYRYFKRTEAGSSSRENQTLQQGILDEEWDVISLQQASDLSGQYETYFPYLPDLKAWIGDRSDARIVFHQTWAYPAHSTQAAFANYGNDQETMYKAIVDAVSRATAACGIPTVIPAGTAVQNARNSQLGDTLNRDGLHLELTYGRFLAACVWYEILSGNNVEENPYRPAAVPEETAVLCRKAAHQACLHPCEITPIN